MTSPLGRTRHTDALRRVLADLEFVRDVARDEVAAAQDDPAALELARQDLADHEDRLEAVEVALATLEGPKDDCSLGDTIEPMRGG